MKVDGNNNTLSFLKEFGYKKIRRFSYIKLLKPFIFNVTLVDPASKCSSNNAR